jgi:DNA invertase Pin-like site-specific DNA recombinase
MTAKPRLRCAIYTRKSSDEGLDQAFNSLDAQREAGEAYVKSQAPEGWRPISTRYDDGGFSGGSMDRPGLQRLMADIDAGLIDVVVVYKIDRLTRSLADFARIVERFDAHSVSFVSVTQAFNTTSSMGRLTLNVLLSFAQFEREVTGERIRDKIAASKAKGMWMGGVLPLGYDRPTPGTRMLQINAAEAETVRHIFTRYLALASVHRLAEELTRQGIFSKRRLTPSGTIAGGVPFSRGALFHLLRNRLYLGQIPHKGVVYDGQHEAIIASTLFDQVQSLLASQTRLRRDTSSGSLARAYLTGRIFDATGQAMTPTHTRGRAGKLYRYYVSAPLQQGGIAKAHGSTLALQRISASALEEVIDATLARLLSHEADPLRHLIRIEVYTQHLTLHIKASSKTFLGSLNADERLLRDPETTGIHHLILPIALCRTGSRIAISTGEASRNRRDPTMISALRRAHAAMGHDGKGPMLTSAPASQYGRRLVGLALLAPDIQRDILAGRQPQHLTLAILMADELPLNWRRQRERFGFIDRNQPPVD